MESRRRSYARNARLDRRGAFTLLELLVVIAIIALLISILLPSLEAARRASKNSACLAHIKNIGTSSRVYEADDASGWGIPVHPLQYRQPQDSPTYIGAYEWGGKSGIGRPDFLGGGGSFKDPLNSKYGTKAGFGPGTRPMNEILYPGGFRDNKRDRRGMEQDTQMELELFKCPADDGAPRGGHCADWVKNYSATSSYDYFGNSYSANLFMVGSTSGEGCFLSNSPYLRPTSRVPTPARTLYFEENIGRWAWAAREDQCDFLKGIDVGATKAIRGWHGRDWTFNRTFVDAHADTQRIYVEGTEDNLGYAHHYVVEKLSSYPPFILTCKDTIGADGGDESDREQNYRCIIVRGPNWQKDTMPSPFIQTGLRWQVGDDKRPSYEDCVEKDEDD